MADLTPFFSDDDYVLTNPPAPGKPAPPPAPVTMDLILGSLGQSATYTLMLDGTPIFTHEKVSHKNIPLGDTVTLKNKILTCVGNIVDMPGTDDTLTLDYTVRGGVAPLVKSNSVSGTTGDIMHFTFIIRFI